MTITGVPEWLTVYLRAHRTGVSRKRQNSRIGREGLGASPEMIRVQDQRPWKEPRIAPSKTGRNRIVHKCRGLNRTGRSRIDPSKNGHRLAGHNRTGHIKIEARGGDHPKIGPLKALAPLNVSSARTGERVDPANSGKGDPTNRVVTPAIEVLLERGRREQEIVDRVRAVRRESGQNHLTARLMPVLVRRQGQSRIKLLRDHKRVRMIRDAP